MECATLTMLRLSKDGQVGVWAPVSSVYTFPCAREGTASIDTADPQLHILPVMLLQSRALLGASGTWLDQLATHLDEEMLGDMTQSRRCDELLTT